ncbi:MAG: outer membrane protein [Methylocystis sp.]|uniref:outer membrane protein n=1 Tax=Methylocystis sp. TaxID=1911079 RepID=UPI003D0A4B25
MKKALSVAALAVALTGSALAADLPSYKAPPPPPLPPPPLWTGFYVGLNAGGTWGNSNNIYVSSFPIFRTPGLGPVLFSNAAALGGTGVFSSNSGGFIGGGQVGYNWQFYNGKVLAGVEADIQGIAYSNNNRNYVSAVPVFGPFSVVSAMSARKSLDYLGTVRGRLGWLFTPTLLVYGTGGLAYGGVNLNVAGFQGVTPDFAPFATVGFPGGSFSDTRVGYTVGGGLEWMFMPQWSAKVEYLYYDLGSVRTSGGLTTRTFAGNLLWANATEVSARFNGNIVRAGVNYHFNWGAPPIVAKY